MPRSTVDDGRGSTGRHSRPCLDSGATVASAAGPIDDWSAARWARHGTRATGRSVLQELASFDLTVDDDAFERAHQRGQPAIREVTSRPREEISAPVTTPSPSSQRQAWGGHPQDQPRIAALLRLAQRGDGEAFGRIYDRYVNQVYRYVYYRLGSHALAEDLTSETFLRALRRIDSFSWQGRDIGAWFITIARNLVNDHVKSSRFRLEVPTGDMLDADLADDGIEQVVLDRVANAVVLEALRELKPEQQECLILRFMQGLSVAETAHVMDRSDGAIKQLQLRAVRALARSLNRRREVRLDDDDEISALAGAIGSTGERLAP